MDMTNQAMPESPPQTVLRRRLDREAEARARREAELRELERLRTERDSAKSTLLLARGGIGGALQEAREARDQAEQARKTAEKEATDAILVATELRIWREQHEKIQAAAGERADQASTQLAAAINFS